jgi:hypothetical protein
VDKPRRRRRERFTHCPSQSQGQHDAHEQQLRPWHEVRDLWNQRSGQNLSKGVIWFICRNAEKKPKKLLAGELGGAR